MPSLKEIHHMMFTFKHQLMLMLLGNFIAIVLAVTGLGIFMSVCHAGPGSAALVAHFKPEYQAYAQARFDAFDPDHFTCSEYWQFQWTMWTLQCVWLILTILAYAKNLMRHFLVGLSCIAAVLVSWQVYTANDLAHIFSRTETNVKAASKVQLVGTIGLIISNFCIILFAGGLIQQQNNERSQGKDADMA